VRRVPLAYGRGTLGVDVPDDAVVVATAPVPALDDEGAAVRAALRAPVAGPALADLVPRRCEVVVVFPDLTRPMPNRVVLPAVLAELQSAGVGPERIRLLCATGSHRTATPAELAELVGEEIVARYRIHQHRADDPDHLEVGSVDGAPILLDARYVEAALRICTGFVEPHFFAGWSGGPKAVCPGLAALETILEAHRPDRIADPRAAFTVLDGNPVHEFVATATALAPPQLCLDVAINRQRQLTAAFAGPLPAAHRAACRYVEGTSVSRVDGPFEVVVTTNGGHPLDRNLYQAVKGMAAAERVVVSGGQIVLAAACVDGMPEGSAFDRLLDGATAPAELAAADGPARLDRWQTQILGRVLGRADVWLHTDGLDDDEVRRACLRPAPDLQAAVDGALLRAGPAARCCVLAEGPLTVARLR
jgi:nickel-dependent lactate racemase